MKVTYRLEQKDLWHGAWFTYTRHPLFVVLWLIYLLVLIHAAWPGMVEHRYAETRMMVGVQVACCAIALFFATAYLILKRMPSRNTVRECTDQIDAWGYRCFLPEGEQKIAWRKVWQIRETADYIFIFAGSGRGYPIPKRGFAGVEEAEQFKRMALDYWQAARNGAPAEPPPSENSWPPAPKSAKSEKHEP